MHYLPLSFSISSLFLYRMSIWLVPASSQLMSCLVCLLLTPSTTQFFSLLSSATFPKLSSPQLLNFLVTSPDFFYLSFSWSFLTKVLTHLNCFLLNLFNKTYSQKPICVYTILYLALSLLCYNLLLKGGVGQMFRWRGHLFSGRMGEDLNLIIDNTQGFISKYKYCNVNFICDEQLKQ